MRRRGRFGRLRRAALVSALALGPASTAGAAPSAEARASIDYAVWAGRFERAETDAERRALVEAAPALGWIWFHGYVYDLATPGIPEPEKARIRATADLVAEALGAVEPRLLLDRADDGTLGEIAAQVRAGAEAVIDAMRRGQGPEVAVVEAGDALVAEAIVYNLLQRAYVVRGALGGAAEAAVLADGARAAALAWLGLSGEARAWRATRRCDDLPGREPPLPRLRLRAAADALIAGDAPTAWVEADAARRLATGRQESPLSLTALGVQAAADADAQPARGRLELMTLEAALRKGGAAWAADRVAPRRLAPLDPPALATVATRLAASKAAQGDHQIVAALADAALRLREAGRARTDAGDPEGALPLLDAASALLDFLGGSDVLARTSPSAVRAAVTAERARAQAEVELARARLAERTGRLDEALASARRAVEAFPPGDRGPAHALVGELALALGLFDEADAATAAAEASETLSVEAQVDNRWVRARLRLAQRRWGAAFAHANRGLRALRSAGLAEVERPRRAALHHVAALALDGDGRPEAAAARLVFALGVHPRIDAALDLAALRLEAGDRAGAEAALAGLDAPEVRAARGCLRAVHDGPGARAALAGLGDAAGPIALVCRAVALSADDPAQARRLVDAAGVGPATDPRLAWVAAAVRGDLDGAAAAWRRARGFAAMRLDRRRALAPIAAASWVPAVAVAAGSVEGLAGSVWWRQAVEAPRVAPPTLPASLLALAAEVEGRAAAAALPTAEAVAVERLADARARWAAALDALDAEAPAWAAMARPAWAETLAPTEGLRLYLQTGPAGGRGWLFAGDGAPVKWTLPGGAALDAAAAPLRDVLRAATPWPVDAADPEDPHAEQWRALARLTKTLAPPLADPETHRGARLEVWADGPLAGLPLEALVVEPPRRAGLAPRFLADGRVMVHRASAAPLAVAEPGALAAVELAVPVEAALDALDARVIRRAGGPETVDARAVWWVGRAALPAGAPRVVVAAEAGPPPPTLRARGVARLIRGAGQVPPEVAARLLASLLERPPRAALRFAPPAGGQAAQLAPAVVIGAGAPVGADEALSRLRAAAFAAPVVGGEVPAHHPSRWAWLVGVAP